ncbi:MAG: ribosome maturation factor RimM [Faecalicoccus sp.]|uniref:ribosome maturation factor RimM n=1 Tax=Faecalicoccus sp. TaxID=1971758 RepID=UPI002F930D41
MIKVGTIINTHGLKGECKIYLVTDDVKDRFAKGRILHLSDGKKLTVSSFRMQKGFGYAKFEEIKDINDAEKLKTFDLLIAKEDLSPLEKGTYYYHELMDCTVYDDKGDECGIVSDILETGKHIVLRISKDQDSFLLPFVPAFILEVDPETKKIIFKDMEGLR